ncbi:KID repeat-containing protein, partial [Clostridium perfringens F262]
MFKVSEAFNKEINKLQGRKFNAKVIIRDKEYSGNQIYEMNLEESVNPSDSFSIGSICSNSFDIKLINTGDIFDNAIVKPYVGLYIGDDIEYIPLGVFTVIKTSVKGKFINLECVDNMLGLEKVYFSDLSYPADINDIAKEICKKAGVNLASKLPNYRVNKIEGYSLREAIGFIASLCGSFARFNRIGDLEVRDYEVVKQEMTPHNLFKLDIEANECIIKKVIAKKGEEELSTGTDDGNKIVFNNPIITKEILSDIYTKYNGFKYIPYTAKWKGNPAIMAGDILNLTDLNGNKYNTLIMEQKFTYKNGISSEVKAKGKTRQDSSFDNKGSVTQSMERYSIEQANIKKALIDKASINDLTAVDAKIQRLYTDDLTAIRADIVTLNSQKANIVELNSIKADLQQAIIGKANITDLNAAVGKINVLESKTASIENALNKNLTAENIATGAITAGSGIIAEGAIGDAEISSLSVNKLKVGDITTSKHRIVSADGTIEIVGNQILINRNNVNRVILGEYRKTDSTTDYGLLIRGKDGKTIMIDSDGVHNAGITNGAIDNNKVADNANISGNKLDINSVIREVNNNGTETIKGTKVTVGDRTLDVELSTQNNTITEHSKELSSQKASLTALDNALKFKVDSQTFTQSTTTINNNINRAKEEAINSSNSHADSKANEALNNAKAFVNSEITNVNTHLNKNTSEINILKDQIESKVSQSDIDKSIQNIEFGGRNLFLKSKGPFKSSNEYVGISITSVVEKYLNKKITISADVKANKVGKIRFYSLGGYSVGFWVERDVTTEWTRIKATGKFTLNDEKQKWCDLSFYGTYGSGLFTEVRNVKIELGELASDYTEAPEDTDKLIIDNIKTVTDKISTVESKLTQENNSIKASVQDLNSTTQSITTNVSNINRDLISKINSNLAVAKSFATDIAIAKANLAREQAIASADGKITEEERKRIQQAQENLDTAIARADKAKQDAINAASTDATNKANNALNSAKAFVNAEITTVNNKVHN